MGGAISWEVRSRGRRDLVGGAISERPAASRRTRRAPVGAGKGERLGVVWVRVPEEGRGGRCVRSGVCVMDPDEGASCWQTGNLGRSRPISASLRGPACSRRVRACHVEGRGRQQAAGSGQQAAEAAGSGQQAADTGGPIGRRGAACGTGQQAPCQPPQHIYYEGSEPPRDMHVVSPALSLGTYCRPDALLDTTDETTAFCARQRRTVTPEAHIV